MKIKLPGKVVLWRAGIAAVGSLLLLAKQLVADDGTLDVAELLSRIDFGELLELAGIGAIFSQLFARKGDTSPAKLEAVVDQKVQAKLASIPPAAAVQPLTLDDEPTV